MMRNRMPNVYDSPRTESPGTSKVMLKVGVSCETGDALCTAQGLNRLKRNSPMKRTRQVGLTSSLSVLTGFLPLL